MIVRDMAGLVPAIHALAAVKKSAVKKDMDARDKPGHDEVGVESAEGLADRA